MKLDWNDPDVLALRNTSRPAPAPPAPAPVDPDASTSIAGDMGRSLGVGLDQLGSLAGVGMRKVGLEKAGDFVKGYYDDRAALLTEQMSEEQKAANATPFLSGDLTAPQSFRKIAGMAAGSAPAMALGMGVGGAATKGLLAAGMRPVAAGIVGGAGGEASVGAGLNYLDVYDQAQSLDMQAVPEYQTALASITEGTDEERAVLAREKVATALALKSAGVVGLATGVLGAPSGAAFAKLLGGETGKTALRSISKQAGLEVLQEAPQSAVETYQTGEVLATIDPSKRATLSELAESAVSGAIAGGVLGGAMGGVGEAMAPKTKTRERTLDLLKFKAQNPDVEVSDQDAADFIERKVPLTGEAPPAPLITDQTAAPLPVETQTGVLAGVEPTPAAPLLELTAPVSISLASGEVIPAQQFYRLLNERLDAKAGAMTKEEVIRSRRRLMREETQFFEVQAIKAVPEEQRSGAEKAKLTKYNNWLAETIPAEAVTEQKELVNDLSSLSVAGSASRQEVQESSVRVQGGEVALETKSVNPLTVPQEQATLPETSKGEAVTTYKRTNPPQVAGPTVIEPKVSVTLPLRDGTTQKHNGKGYAFPGFEEYQFALIPPSGSKAGATKAGYRVVEVSTGSVIAESPVLPYSPSTEADALERAQGLLQSLPKATLESAIQKKLGLDKGSVAPPTPTPPAGKQAWEMDKQTFLATEEPAAQVAAAQSIEDEVYSRKPKALPKSQQGNLAAMSAHEEAVQKWRQEYKAAIKATAAAEDVAAEAAVVTAGGPTLPRLKRGYKRSTFTVADPVYKNYVFVEDVSPKGVKTLYTKKNGEAEVKAATPAIAAKLAKLDRTEAKFEEGTDETDLQAEVRRIMSLAPEEESVTYEIQTASPMVALTKAIAQETGQPVAQGTFTQVAAPKGQEALFAALAQTLKKEIVFFKNNGAPMTFNGATGIAEDTIYVNIDAAKPHLVVTGHEFLHDLKREEPETYAVLRDVVMDVIPERRRLEMWKGLTAKRLREGRGPIDLTAIDEELVADFFGEQFTSKEFWAKVERRNPEGFAGLVQRLVAFLERIKAALTGEARADIERAQTAAAEALARYVAKNPEAAHDLKFAELPVKVSAFFSQLDRVVGQKMGGRMPVADLTKMLKNNGVTDAEIEQLIGSLSGTVTKQQVVDEIAANTVSFEDVVLGGAELRSDRAVTWGEWSDPDQFGDQVKVAATGERIVRASDGYIDAYDAEGEVLREGMVDEGKAKEIALGATQETNPPTHFSQYTEPGAVEGSYRELFVTAPDLNNPSDKGRLWRDGHAQYQDVENPIVRIRFNERQVNGQRVLFVEEIQGPSDANQQKMPEYLKKRIYDIGVKRVLAYAQENGFAGVSWTTGEMQAKRYDLSKEVESIEAAPNSNGTYELVIDTKNHGRMTKHDLTAQEVEDNVGKELAKKIIDDSKAWTDANTAYRDALKKSDGSVSDAEYDRLRAVRDAVPLEYSGLDLKVGGEGLKSLYDRTLPALFKKYVKGEVGKTAILTRAKKQYFVDDAPNSLGDWAVRNEDDVIEQTFPSRAAAQAQADMWESDKTDAVHFIPLTAKTPASFPQFSETRAPSLMLSQVIQGMKADLVAKAQPRVKPIEVNYEQTGGTPAGDNAAARRRQQERSLFEALGYGNSAVSLGEATHALAAQVTAGKLSRDGAAQAFGAALSKINADNLKDIRADLQAMGYVIPASGKEAVTATFIALGSAWQGYNTSAPQFSESYAAAPKKNLQALKDSLLSGRVTTQALPSVLKVTPLPILADVADTMRLPWVRTFYKATMQRDAVSNGIVTDFGLLGKELAQSKETATLVANVADVASIHQMKPQDDIYSQDWVAEAMRGAEDTKPETKEALLKGAQTAWEAAGMQTSTGKTFREAYLASRQAFDALPEDLQEHYLRAVEMMKDLRQREKDAAQALIEEHTQDNPKLRTEQIAQLDFAYNNLKGNYWPVYRKGDYTLDYIETATGLRGYSSFDTVFEREVVAKSLVDSGLVDPATIKLSKKADTPRGSYGVPAGYNTALGKAIEDKAIAAATEGIDPKDVQAMEAATAQARQTAQETIQTLHEVWLRFQPEASAAKNMMRRKNIKGYDGDMVRGFLEYGQTHGVKVAQMEQGRRVERTINDMAAAIRGRSGDTTREMAILNDLRAREAVKSQPSHWLAKKLGAWTTFRYMTSPSIALVQMTQLGILTFPKLATLAGSSPTKAAAALRRGTQAAFSTKFTRDQMLGDVAVQTVYDSLHEVVTTETRRENPGQYDNVPLGTAVYTPAELQNLIDKLTPYQQQLLALQEAMDRGLLDISLSHEVNEQVERKDMNPITGRVFDLGMTFMRESEKASRKAAILAAFEVGGGAKDFFAGMETVAEVVDNTLFNYSKSAKGTALQGDLVRVLTTFQTFRINVIGKLFILFRQTIKGETPEVQQAAKRELIGIFGMSGILAGTLGMPFAPLIFQLFDAIVGDDDDEPSEEQFRKWLAENFGQATSDVVTEGVPSLLGASLSRRIGLGDVVGTSAEMPARLVGDGALNWYATQLAGPSYSMVAGYAKGYNEIFNEGEVVKGLISSTPKPIGDALKAYGFATDGVKTGMGKRLLTADQVGPNEVLLQAFGFAPLEIGRLKSAQYDVNTRSTRLSMQWGQIKQDLVKAYIDGEPTDDEMIKVREFLAAHPGLVQNAGGEIRSSLREYLKKDLGVDSRREVLLKR